MGSCASGNYGSRSYDVTFADDVPCVDLLGFRRRGWLRPGCAAMGMFEIPQRTGLRLKAYAECEVQESVGYLRLRFDIAPDLVTDLACTPQPIGGVRWWLVCPLCDKNKGKLFFGGREGWGCRACHQLRYRSQHLRPAARAKARCEWYCERAGTFEWVATPRRPLRMHRATFDRLLARADFHRQRWRELGVIPHEKEMLEFVTKIRRRNARALRRLIPR